MPTCASAPVVTSVPIDRSDPNIKSAQSTMTGLERMARIHRHVAAWAKVRTVRFVAGEFPILPCWGDEIDMLIAAELDKVTGPLQIGLWMWEVPIDTKM